MAGLAVLSVLYFSHARDVKRLREWAGRAPERSRPSLASGAARDQTVSIALAGLLLLGSAAFYGVTRLIVDDGAAKSANAKPKRTGATLKPGAVTVAVLNGTTVPGLAATLRDQIAAAGFKAGMIDVYSDQHLAASVVQYTPGHQDAANAVGRRLGISDRELVTANSRALAGGATVIVIAGADKAP